VRKVEKSLISNPEHAYRLALKIYDDNDLTDKLRIRLLFSLLNVSNQTQRFSEAIRYGTEGLDLAEKSNYTVSQVKFLGTLGNIYQSLQVNDKAKNYLNKAEDVLKKNKLPNSEQHIAGNILYLKGMNYAYTLDCDMALIYFDQAISAFRTAKDPLSQMNIKLAYLNKANCLIEMNKLKEAEHYLLLSKINNSEFNTSAGIPQIYFEILNQSYDLGTAKILALKNNLNRSNEILLSILDIKDQKNISDTKTDIYFLLSQNFLKLRDMDKSQFYDALYHQKIAERNNLQIEILNNLLVQDQRNADQKIEEHKRKMVKWSIVSISFLSVFSLFLTLILRKIKKVNSFLEKELYSSVN
jgi:tetratricopeptide (TPR) repeat protein